MFALIPKSFFSLDSTFASKVLELTPNGKKIGQIVGKVPRGPHTHVNGQVAVTRGGHTVFLAGDSTSNGEAGSFTPFVGEYSAATRRFIRGTNFDTSRGDWASAAAVDATGQHLYVADHVNRHSNRIFEFRIGDLHLERVFTPHGEGASFATASRRLPPAVPTTTCTPCWGMATDPSSRCIAPVASSYGRCHR